MLRGLIDCDWYRYSKANRLVVVILICGISLTRLLLTNNKAISFIEQASDSDRFPHLADMVATVLLLTMAFPRVIHKGLGVYWGVSHRNSCHSTSQAARVALVFGFLHFASTYATGAILRPHPYIFRLPLGFTYRGGVALSTRLFYIPNYTGRCWSRHNTGV